MIDMSRTSVDLTTKVEGRYPVPGDREGRAAVSSIGRYLHARAFFPLCAASPWPSFPEL